MEVSFSYFWQDMAGNPILCIMVLFTLGVIFVNGWTGSFGMRLPLCVTNICLACEAILMSAAFNFLGVFIMTKLNSAVASTISNMVDFGNNTHYAMIAPAPYCCRL